MESAIVGAFHAKTHLPELLRRVGGGEEIVITKHGKALARLVPIFGLRKPSVCLAIEEIKKLRGMDAVVENLQSESKPTT